MKNYIKLARPHHWIKNCLVLLPLLCSGHLLEVERLAAAVFGFFAFSFLASGIYVINDIRDQEKDRNNSTKCHRPIASGAIGTKQAVVFAVGILLAAVLLTVLASGHIWQGYAAAAVYFLLNLGYSFGLKKIPLVDIAILAAGFLLRLIFGGAVAQIVLSKWLCLTIISLSFFMGLGKRRGELKGQKGDTRAVLKFYSHEFLDKNMYMSMTLTVLFYCLWTVDALTVAHVGSENLVWTVPLVILICMKYSLDVEGESNGDPVEVLLRDKVLLLMGLLLALIVVAVIYI